jgi:hypothetical protein
MEEPVFARVQSIREGIAEGRITPGLNALKAIEEAGLLLLEPIVQYNHDLDLLINNQLARINNTGDIEAIPYLEKMLDAKQGDRNYPGEWNQSQIPHILSGLKAKHAAKDKVWGITSIPKVTISHIVRDFLLASVKNSSEEKIFPGDWIGALLKKRPDLLVEAQKRWDTLSNANSNLALKNLFLMVKDDPERIIAELKEAYPFLGMDADSMGPAVQDYYQNEYSGFFAGQIGISDKGMEDAVRSTGIDWRVGNPTMLFNPHLNRALLAFCRAVMSKGMEEALEKLGKEYGCEITAEVKEAIRLIKEAEVVSHELKHVALSAVLAYLWNKQKFGTKVPQSALNTVAEGLNWLNTSGMKIIAPLAKYLPYTQGEEKGFLYDPIDYTYVVARNLCLLNESGKTMEKNILETIAYGLRASCYEYEDLTPCNSEAELNVAYNKLINSLSALENYAQYEGLNPDAPDAQEKINSLKAPLAKITSTYRMESKNSELNKKSLEFLQLFINAMGEGNMLDLTEGFFTQFLEEHEGFIFG